MNEQPLSDCCHWPIRATISKDKNYAILRCTRCNAICGEIPSIAIFFDKPLLKQQRKSEPQPNTKRILKYATGESVPDGAIYLGTITNGDMPKDPSHRKFVWHYFLVDESVVNDMHIEVKLERGKP